MTASTKPREHGNRPAKFLASLLIVCLFVGQTLPARAAGGEAQSVHARSETSEKLRVARPVEPSIISPEGLRAALDEIVRRRAALRSAVPANPKALGRARAQIETGAYLSAATPVRPAPPPSVATEADLTDRPASRPATEEDFYDATILSPPSPPPPPPPPTTLRSDSSLVVPETRIEPGSEDAVRLAALHKQGPILLGVELLAEEKQRTGKGLVQLQKLLEEAQAVQVWHPQRLDPSVRPYVSGIVERYVGLWPLAYNVALGVIIALYEEHRHDEARREILAHLLLDLAAARKASEDAAPTVWETIETRAQWVFLLVVAWASGAAMTRTVWGNRLASGLMSKSTTAVDWLAKIFRRGKSHMLDDVTAAGAGSSSIGGATGGGPALLGPGGPSAAWPGVVDEIVISTERAAGTGSAIVRFVPGGTAATEATTRSARAWIRGTMTHKYWRYVFWPVGVAVGGGIIGLAETGVKAGAKAIVHMLLKVRLDPHFGAEIIRAAMAREVIETLRQRDKEIETAGSANRLRVTSEIVDTVVHIMQFTPPEDWNRPIGSPDGKAAVPGIEQEWATDDETASDEGDKSAEAEAKAEQAVPPFPSPKLLIDELQRALIQDVAAKT